MGTLLHALTSKNPTLDTSRVIPGPNTEVKFDETPRGWIPWEEFSYNNLTAIFSEQLKARYDGPSTSHASILPLDLQIVNEQTFEWSLSRFIMPVVNHCLDTSSAKPHYGPGSRCPNASVKPDWSCIGFGKYQNYVPGDTKLSAKFWPSMLETNSTEWKKVIGQVVFYQLNFGSRYGFIISDDALVVLRITSELIEPGLSASRIRRYEKTFESSYDVAHNSVVNDSLADTSYTHSTASFVDDDAENRELRLPEYAVIRWDAHGSKRLTVKLALWCLAMIGVNGDNRIREFYPALNSWRVDNGRYIHNSTGVSKRHIEHNAVIQDPGPGTSDAVTGDLYNAESYLLTNRQRGYSHREVGREKEAADDGYETTIDEVEHGYDAESQADINQGREAEDDEGGERARLDEGEDIDNPGEENGYGDTNTGEGGTGSINIDEYSDTETITQHLKRMRVTIKKHRSNQQFYYVDHRGRKLDTVVSDWERVRHHYELRTRRYVYVADGFPK